MALARDFNVFLAQTIRLKKLKKATINVEMPCSAN